MIKEDKSEIRCEDFRFEEYRKFLQSSGAVISPKLGCAFFQLRNGLPYPGLFAKQDINIPKITGDEGKQQFLVVLPLHLLATSYQAQNCSNQQLRHVFSSEQFYHSGPAWQNRILITYILFILDAEKDNVWSKMASMFSKDIDILSFWDDQQIELFRDKSIIKAAKLEREKFQKQWQQFSIIKDKHEVLKLSTFTYQNYRWIYTHVISRCFGSFLNSTYFVPFCQFFNHNCVDVSYSCLTLKQFSEKIEGKQTESQNMQCKNIEIPKQKQKQEDESSQISQISQLSGNSEDYIDDGDFSYEDVNTYSIKWFTKKSYNLKPKEVGEIQKLHQRVIQHLQAKLYWKGFSLLYIGEIIQKNNLIMNQYLAERKRFSQAKQQLQLLVYHIGLFRRLTTQYYKKMGSVYKKEESALVTSIKESNQIKESKSEAPSKQYKYFAMICHPNQYFKKGSQVYFQYSRLSNRALLLGYGFSLQNNKYEHVWIKRSMAKYIGQYPDLFKKIQQKGLPIVFKLKLKPYVLNTQIIMLEKIEKWKIYGQVTESNVRDFEKIYSITDIQNQIQIIDRVIQLYESELLKYNQQGQGRGLVDLRNKQLSYHQYFIAVYHNEKVKIIQLQIKLLRLSKQVLSKVQKQKRKMTMREVEKIVKEVSRGREVGKMIWGYLKTLDCIKHN